MSKDSLHLCSKQPEQYRSRTMASVLMSFGLSLQHGIGLLQWLKVRENDKLKRKGEKTKGNACYCDIVRGTRCYGERCDFSLKKNFLTSLQSLDLEDLGLLRWDASVVTDAVTPTNNGGSGEDSCNATGKPPSALLRLHCCWSIRMCKRNWLLAAVALLK